MPHGLNVCGHIYRSGSGALKPDDQNKPKGLNSEAREALKRRIADLTAGMEALDHLRRPGNIAEWAALYEEREALDQQLGDDD